MSVAGRTYAMDAQLTHRSDDGRLVIVSVLLEPGSENPVIQTALNNCWRGEVSRRRRTSISNVCCRRAGPISPSWARWTVPPCSEDVTWLVLKQPQQISAAQLAIFERLYPPNARPLQPALGRIIKESR